MAKSSALGLTMLCFVLAMSPITVHSNSLKEIILYATYITSGPDASFVLVAGPSNATTFGAVNVYNLLLSETIDTDSPVVGSLQGFCAVTARDGTRSYFSNTATIERGKYRVGSFQNQGILTLQASGYTVSGELGVPAGTGSYRNVIGVMNVQTIRQVPGTNTAILLIRISYRQLD